MVHSRPLAATSALTAAAAAAAARWRPRWRVAVVAGILLVLTNGPVFLFAKSVLDRPGHWEDAAVWPFFAAAAAASAALALGDPVARARRPESGAEIVAVAAVIWYSLLSVASTAWSVDPGDTAWRSTVYLGLAALAWMVSVLDSDDLRAVLSLLCGAAIATSVALVLLRPDLGTASDGAWQGVYTNPNSLAPLAALGALVGIRFLWSGGRSTRLAGGGLAAASLACMVGAGSRTAWFALLFGAGAAAVPIAHRRLCSLRGTPAANRTAATATVVGAVGTGAALAALWNVSTFAQRRTMWSLVWDRVWERPIAGHGFFTFWDIPELTLHVLLRRGSAHNSLMEVGLGLGLLGLVPFLAIVAVSARNAALRLWRDPGPDTWLWAAVVAFLLVENAAESFVLWFSYNWVLVMAASLRPVPPRRVTAHAQHAVF